MKNVRFYAVMPENRGSKSASKKHPFAPWTVDYLRSVAERGGEIECFALDVSDRNWRHKPGGAGSAIEGCFTSIAYTTIDLEWLRKRTTRIPEDLARQLHPQLVAYMGET